MCLFSFKRASEHEREMTEDPEQALCRGPDAGLHLPNREVTA